MTDLIDLSFLDTAVGLLSDQETIPQGMTLIVKELDLVRERIDQSTWSKVCTRIRDTHPIMHLLHECPATSRALQRPRGYPGDAVLLDLLYAPNDDHRLKQAATPRGQAICRWLAKCASPSLNWRLDTLAQAIDETAYNTPGTRILSVACGHLREGHRSHAVSDEAIGTFIALDQDPRSLSLVKEDFAQKGVTPVQSSIGKILRGETKLSMKFDLIYAAGLYDYLDQDTACALNMALVSLLSDDGRLLIANFQPGGREFAYMDCCMDWPLMYRGAQALKATMASVPIRSLRWFTDPWGYVGYIDVRK